MKVVLTEDVKNVGVMGSVVNVSDGYARNFLIPKKFAVEANLKNVKALEHEKKKIEEKIKKVKASAQGLAERLSALTISLRAKTGEEGKLFGSITTMDIAEALKKEGIDIDKKKIVLEEQIKKLGSYKAGVKVHSDVTASLNINVIAE